MSEPATEKQMNYIKSLGGNVTPNMTFEEASQLLDELAPKALATEKQLGYLRRLGVEPAKGLNRIQASEMIDKLVSKQPPSQYQLGRIAEFGATAPATRAEADELINSLIKTSQATDTQRQRATELGVELPDGVSYLNADRIIEEVERDNDPDDGKQPTKAQLAKIAKLGGDASRAINMWRADEYIADLEMAFAEEQEKIEEAANELIDRAEEILETEFGDSESRELMDVKKPSRAVMIKAIEHGDAQWGKGWDDICNPKYDYFSLISTAVYAVAPQLLKKNHQPPKPILNAPKQQPAASPTTQSPGCLGILILLGVILLAVVVIVIRGL